MWTNNEQDFLLVGGPQNPTGYILIDDTVAGAAAILFFRTFISLPEHPTIDNDPRDVLAPLPLAGSIVFNNQEVTINAPENVGSIFMGFAPFLALNAYGKATPGDTRRYGAMEVGPALLSQAFILAGSPNTAFPWTNHIPGNKLVTIGDVKDLNGNALPPLVLIGNIDNYVGGALPVLQVLNNQTGVTAHIIYDNGNATFANGEIFFFSNGDITQLAGTLSPNALAIPPANYGGRSDMATINTPGRDGTANTISRSDHIHADALSSVQDQAAYSNATTGFTDVTGMSATLLANATYIVEFFGAWTASALIALKLNVPAMGVVTESIMSEIWNTTGSTAPSASMAYITAATAFPHTGAAAAIINTNYQFKMRLLIKVGASNVICKLQAAASAAGTITMPAGSYAMTVTRVN